MSSPWLARKARWRNSTTRSGASAARPPGALDLKDFDAIDRLGGAIHERWGKLDILIGMPACWAC